MPLRQVNRSALVVKEMTKMSESDFEKLEIQKCDKSIVNDFFKVINSRTLGKKVANALDLKKQGHFNKAVLIITEVNRDQVLAIREIQSTLDKVEGRTKTEVIFDKFRQVLPLQIGLTNAEEVLELLNQIKADCNGDFIEIITELHNNEDELDRLTDELSFFQERMKGRISERELNEIKVKVSVSANKIVSTKKILLDNLIRFVTKKIYSNTIDDRLKMIKDFYLIITSSIETLDAKMVKV